MMTTLFFLYFFIQPTVDFQNVGSISGKVTDPKGESIIGANILLSQSGVLKFSTMSDLDGNYTLSNIPDTIYTLEVKSVGYKTFRKENIKVENGKDFKLNIQLGEEATSLEVVVIKEYKKPQFAKDQTTGGVIVTSEEIQKMPNRNINAVSATVAGKKASKYNDSKVKKCETPPSASPIYHEEGNESYAKINENKFVKTTDEALSTFSLDVDRASYSNIRRFVNTGQLPPTDAVRVEEMINYFPYNYAAPTGNDLLDVQTTLVNCPWNSDHQLLHLGVQSKKMDLKSLPLSNLVFLIDVSGSMNSPNKLPLVIASFKLLLDQLRPDDRVAIVTYAGAAGVPLPSTKASEKTKILDCLERLQAGGSTAGAQGILTAYQIAQDNFIKDGNNRVILATDGDFNVGVSDNGGLETLIENKRKSGVFLSVLGFGTGNYKDDKMQILADKGNGNHAYIDDFQEAKKVFVNEFGGSVFTLAKDVKFQIEFNPAVVSHYKLIGYENRMLNKEDFNDDTKDAGELGVGHQMTAIYEVVPVGKPVPTSVNKLKYQKEKEVILSADNKEIATVHFRYKLPDSHKSKEWEKPILNSSKEISSTSEDVRFSIAVAHAGLLLRNSDLLKVKSYPDMLKLAKGAKGNDDEGYRAEFIKLMETAKEIKTTQLVGQN